MKSKKKDNNDKLKPSFEETVKRLLELPPKKQSEIKSEKRESCKTKRD